MPWTTPTLRTVREMVRGEITAKVAGASFVGNSVLRVIADAQAAVCHLTLRYLDWLSRQFLPDTAEAEWLDRHADIWLVNADGSVGRKVATLAHGSVTLTGQQGIVVPASTQLTDGTTDYETVDDVTIGNAETPVDILALDPGVAGNHPAGTALGFVAAVAGADGTAIVVELGGGTDDETDQELRARVLRRIRQPPMGGAAYDYEAWALAVPGVTRAWAASEMGIGTVTLRFMMDDLRADNDGFPFAEDIEVVSAYINSKRPVTVKECWVLSPIREPIDFHIVNLVPDTEAVRAAIEVSIEQMLFYYASPGQTIYAAWKYSAVMAATGVVSFDMTTTADDVMPDIGHMAVLGDLYFTTPAPTSAMLAYHG
jgi:uncharacterized phage protein gp47/JayE